MKKSKMAAISKWWPPIWWLPYWIYLIYPNLPNLTPFPPTLALINVVSDTHKGGHAIASCNSIKYGYQFAQ